MIVASVERLDNKGRLALCKVLAELLNPTQLEGQQQQPPLITLEDISLAACKFLSLLDDLILDAPKSVSSNIANKSTRLILIIDALQGTHGAYVFANLYSKGLIQLSLFASLPEENDFTISLRYDVILL